MMVSLNTRDITDVNFVVLASVLAAAYACEEARKKLQVETLPLQVVSQDFCTAPCSIPL